MAYPSSPNPGPSWGRIAVLTGIAFVLMLMLGAVLILFRV